MKLSIAIAIITVAAALLFGAAVLGDDLADRWGDDEDDLRAIVSQQIEVPAPAADDTAVIEQAVSVIFDGLAQLPAQSPRVQWLVFVADGCPPCKAMMADFGPYFAGTPTWTVGPDPTAMIRIVDLGDELAATHGVGLAPTCLLLVDGEVAYRGKYPGKRFLANEWNRQNVALPKVATPKAAVTGMSLGTVKAKPQIAAMIASLKPFLDGGRGEFRYRPAPGVIKQWLVMASNGTGVKIPPETIAVLGLSGDTLTVTFEGTPPQLFAAGFTRSLEQIEISTSRISLNLPWMIDPTWRVE